MKEAEYENKYPAIWLTQSDDLLSWPESVFLAMGEQPWDPGNDWARHAFPTGAKSVRSGAITGAIPNFHRSHQQ